MGTVQHCEALWGVVRVLRVPWEALCAVYGRRYAHTGALRCVVSSLSFVLCCSMFIVPCCVCGRLHCCIVYFVLQHDGAVVSCTGIMARGMTLHEPMGITESTYGTRCMALQNLCPDFTGVDAPQHS